MFSALKGSALWAATLVIVAIIGAATALAWNGTLTGSDWLIIASPILAGVVGITSAHVAAGATAAAINMPPPAAAVQSAQPTPGGDSASPAP
jgi:hypothetical protein